MVKNKKGFLRIVEATVAVLLIISILFIFFIKDKIQNEPDLSENARNVLEEMSKINNLRRLILEYDAEAENPPSIPQELTDFINTRIPQNYLSKEVKICKIDDVCGKSTFTEGNVYAAERIISSVIDTPEFKPRKIKLFIWENSK